jgi:hypothetical protein
MNKTKKIKTGRTRSYMLMCLICVIGFSGCDDSIVTNNLSFTWTMDNPSPGTNTVFLAATSSDPDELRLAVDLNSISNGPAHGVFFDLVFRDEVLSYSGFLKGSVLETAGSPVYQVALDPQDPGRLIVGVSLLNDASVENADGVLMQIRFNALRSGTSSVSFENAKIMTAENGGTIPVTGVSWYGGYATVIE